MIDLQLNSEGKLKHFLTIEGLNKDILTEILDVAESFSSMSSQRVKKVPLLRGRTIVNLFLRIVLEHVQHLSWQPPACQQMC